MRQRRTQLVTQRKHERLTASSCTQSPSKYCWTKLLPLGENEAADACYQWAGRCAARTAHFVGDGPFTFRQISRTRGPVSPPRMQVIGPQAVLPRWVTSAGTIGGRRFSPRGERERGGLPFRWLRGAGYQAVGDSLVKKRRCSDQPFRAGSSLSPAKIKPIQAYSHTSACLSYYWPRRFHDRVVCCPSY